jgi:hypothetical protein
MLLTMGMSHHQWTISNKFWKYGWTQPLKVAFCHYYCDKRAYSGTDPQPLGNCIRPHVTLTLTNLVVPWYLWFHLLYALQRWSQRPTRVPKISGNFSNWWRCTLHMINLIISHLHILYRKLSSSSPESSPSCHSFPQYTYVYVHQQDLSEGARSAVWPGPQTKRIFNFFTKIRNYVKKLKKILTLGSCPHCPMGKVALLPVLPLSLSPTQIQFYFQQLNILTFLEVALYFHCCFNNKIQFSSLF